MRAKNNVKKNCIYIMSSNAAEKYILDSLQVLSVPFGWVCHLRFQKKWVDPELWEIIPFKGEKLNEKLKDIRAIISYLYQERENRDERWKWIAVYPFRFGFLKYAFKTGDSELDIVHLFVEVDSFVSYHDDKQINFFDILKEKLKYKFNKYYASLGEPLEEKFVIPREQSKSAFHKICECIKLEHFKSSDKDGVDYYPATCFIEGFKKKKGKFLKPKYDRHSYKSFYKLRECARYTFEFCSYFAEKPMEFEVKLLCNEKIFSTPAEYKLKISSRYDEESWSIISSLLERDVWTSISFKTELPENINNKKSLDIHLEIPLNIKRKILYRIIDFGGDIGLAVGTGSIALAKVIEKNVDGGISIGFGLLL